MQVPESGDMPGPPQMPEDGDMPDPPQMAENGDMPDPPQMAENGDMPDPTQMQESGDLQADGDMPEPSQKGEDEGFAQVENEAMTEEADATLTGEEPTKTMPYVGIAAAVLAAEILFAVLYRRH